MGDIDNRLKTLIDGFTRPQSAEQMKEFTEPQDGGPTYCLMDDDSLLNRVTVDSRHWFDPRVSEGHALIIATATIVLGRNVDLEAPVGSMFLVL